MELSGSVSLVINIWRKTKYHPVQLRMECPFQQNQTFFYLNELELAPRLAFQKLLQAPRGIQFKIKGNVVNIPADVNNTVNILPRLLQESGTIKVQFKRGLEYKSSALSLNVRPNKILQAANWLATNSILYREQGISFSTDRATSIVQTCHKMKVKLVMFHNPMSK